MLPKIYATLLVFLCLMTVQHVQAQCTTDAGTIDILNATPCEGGTFDVISSIDPVLDADDILRYVLYQNAPGAGTSLAVSTDGVFAWQNNFPVGAPLFVAAVVGNGVAGAIDWADPCLSISSPVTVVFQPKPVITITATCAQQGVILTASVTPANVIYQWYNKANPTVILSRNSTLLVTAPGEYRVFVAIDPTDCSAEASFIVNSISLINTTATVKDVSCNGLSDGSVTVALTGGMAPYSYTLSSGGFVVDDGVVATSPIRVSNLPAGSYVMDITDANGCPASRSFLVKEYAPLDVVAGNGPVQCDGLARLNAVAFGGVTPYNYVWSNGATGSNSGPISGLVSVTVTDANGCTAVSVPVVVQTQTPLSVVANNTAPSGCNAGNGRLTAIAGGGTAPYIYRWSNAVSTAVVQGLSAGTYFITVTDEVGCTAVAKGVVLDGVSNTALDATLTPIRCNGEASGAIDLNITGGSGNFTVDWSNGASSEDLSNLVAGTYTAAVTDVPSGCRTSISLILTQPQPITIAGTVTPSCSGPNTGKIALAVGGGTAPYVYLWSHNANTRDVSGLSIGVYTVTVRDQQNCTATRAFTILAGAAVTLTATTVQTSCGASNGAIVVDVTSGGIAPYTYAWSNAQTTGNGSSAVEPFSIANLAAGSYSVTVFSATGCSGFSNVTVSSSGQLNISTVHSNVSCFGGNNGVATVTVTGGTAPFTYTLNGGPVQTATASPFVINNLNAGAKTLVVTDATGCSRTQTFTVTQAAAINIDAMYPSAVCNQAQLVDIGTAVSGGTSPYTYLWSNGATTSGIGAVPAGTYQVSVQDARGCSATRMIQIGTLPQAVFGTSIKNPDCSTKNGFIFLSSAEPLSYLWNDGSTAPGRVNLDSGLYIVKATHIVSGCMDSDTFRLQRIGLPTLSATTTSARCSQNAGAIQLSVAPAGNYTYLWSTGSTLQNQSGLSAGVYTVTVDGSCPATATFEVKNLGLSVAVTPVSCNGGSNGTIDLSVSGGSGDYSYLWSNNATSQDLTGLAAADYTVTVTDLSDGCSATITAVVSQPPVLQLTETTRNACLGLANGSITLAVSGGTAPYAYIWSNGASTANLGVLPGGIYTVVVADARSCTAFKAITIAQSPQMLAPISNNTPSSCTGATGALTVSPVGGTPPYTVLWSNGATTPAINGLAAGTYTVTVADVIGCTMVTTATVAGSGINFNPSITTTRATCGQNNGTVTLNISGVNPNTLTYLWSNGSNTQSLTQVPGGTYVVTITNAAGCSTTMTGTVLSDSPFNVSIAATNISCYGTNNGAVNFEISGGTPPYFYIWNNGATTQDLNNLAPGIYTVIARDANNCSVTREAIISQPALLYAFAYIITPVSCPACTDGGITSGGIGGSAPYVYQWSNNGTTQDLNGIGAGNYTLTITDANGCTATDQAVVPVSCGPANNLSFLPIVVPNESCGTAPNGTISFNFWGDPGPYAYQWSNGVTNGGGNHAAAPPMYITGLAAGTYQVTVTSVNGACFVFEGEVKNGNPGSLGLSIQSTAPSCGGIANGSISVDIQPRFAVSPYSFTWAGSGATGNGSNIVAEPFDISGLAAGQYSVTVTNGVGCTVVRSVVVANSGLVFTSTVSNSSCTGTPNGQITLNIANHNGQSTYTYKWSNGTTTGSGSFSGTVAVLSGLTGGTYQITVTGSNGCSATDTRVITQGNMSFGVTTTQTAGCGGAANGAVSVNVNNAAAVTPYSYAWSNGVNSGNGSNINSEPFTISNLRAGTYTITVTNGAGCTATNTFNLGTQFAPNISIAPTNPTCYQGTNGQLRVSITTNTAAPYSYAWSNGIASGTGSANNAPFNITGLAASNYAITVTNANGCSNTATATLTQPNQPQLSFQLKEPTCFGQSNGSIIPTYFGANAPFAYNWLSSTGSTYTTPGLTNIPAGTYLLTVTNSLGCKYSPAPIILGQPDALTATAGVNGCGKLIVLAVAQGGTVPYAYRWSDGSTDGAVLNPSSGVYGVTVRDAAGCSATAATLVETAATGDCSAVKGFVRQDLNANCASDNEPGLAGWYVMAKSATATYFATTNADGAYLLRVPPGTYTVNTIAPAPVWDLCPSGPPVSVNQPNDTVNISDLLAKRKVNCPVLSVNIGTGFLRRCFDNYYTVEYCNNGTAKAQNAYIIVTLDPLLSYKNATVPGQPLGNNRYRFNVGNLNIGQCGSFVITASLNCNAALGQAHCTEAHIYPDTLCLPTLAQWSGASLELNSRCATDSLRFVLKNKGAGDMDDVSEYIIIEDHVMLRKMPFQLAAGDSMVISVPSNGHSWRMEARQVSYHPTLSSPMLSVEGCRPGAGAFSTGYVSQFPVNDADPWIDIDCQMNVGAYDPNDKLGFPLGYGVKHYVRPGSELEYRIRFQNTGTDTAFNVVVLDTLSQWLDPSTVRPGASSHPYEFELYGPGILRFIFPHILLPDSNINEAASHGFVKFTIKPRVDAPLETQIHNNAAIYFDFNDPVHTNTTDHRLGVNFVTTSLWQPRVPLAEVSVAPNPFGTEAILSVKGLVKAGSLQLRIVDLSGRPVRDMESAGNTFHLKRGDLPAGLYLYRVEQDGKWIGSGKMAIE